MKTITFYLDFSQNIYHMIRAEVDSGTGDHTITFSDISSFQPKDIGNTIQWYRNRYPNAQVRVYRIVEETEF